MLQSFPLKNWQGEIPTGDHPGAFSSIRKHDIHTGVDLYVSHENETVYAIESGRVVNIENFTGPEVNSPWWLSTMSVLVEGNSGVFCYGEIEPVEGLRIGNKICVGQELGFVKPVLKSGKEKPETIKNHSRYMLHLELYKKGTTESVWWNLNQQKPKCLLDPTRILINVLK